MNTPETDILRDKLNCDLIGPLDVLDSHAKLERERNEARLSGSEYISRTDSMLACEFFMKNEVGRPGCDCRACVMDERDNLRRVCNELATCVERCRDGMKVGFKPLDLEIFNHNLAAYNNLPHRKTKP